MVKNTCAFLFILSLLLLGQSIFINFNTHTFDENSVKNNITYISSDSFKGRLSGTLENLEMSYFIKSKMESAGLKPLEKNYLEGFKVKYPAALKASPHLKVSDSEGNIVKDFKYGTDFKEDMLNFKKNSFNFSSSDDIKGNDSILRLDKDGDSLIFYIGDKNSLQFRSSFLADAAPNSLYVILTKEAFGELKNYISEGYTVDCFIPYSIKETDVYNVAGYIEGKDPRKPPIILSAHYDHLGTDLSGSVYSGALDNASGTAFILEAARYIKSLGIPDRKIIFVAFNAEEFGCLGSKAFVEDHLPMLKGSSVFNFDMIGSDNAVPLCIMGGKQDNNKTPFIKDLSSLCKDAKIPFNFLFEDASDHMYFRKNNIDAVTLCDNDLSKIHTPKDKAIYISSDAIKRCFEVTSKEVISKAYGGNILLLYYKKVIYLCTGSSVIFGFILIKLNTNKNKKTEKTIKVNNKT